VLVVSVPACDQNHRPGATRAAWRSKVIKLGMDTSPVIAVLKPNFYSAYS
jgi:hypothetical protein